MPAIALPGSQVVNVQGPGGMDLSGSLTRIVALQDELQNSALERQVIQQRMGIEQAKAENDQLMAPIMRRFVTAQAAGMEQGTAQNALMMPGKLTAQRQENETQALGNDQLRFNLGRQKTIADKQDRAADDVHQAAVDSDNLAKLMIKAQGIKNDEARYHFEVMKPILQQNILQAKAQTQALNLANQKDMQQLQAMGMANQNKSLYDGLSRWEMMTPEGRAQFKAAHPGTLADFLDPNSTGDYAKDIIGAAVAGLKSSDSQVRESSGAVIGQFMAHLMGVKDDPMAGLVPGAKDKMEELQKNFTDIFTSMQKGKSGTATVGNGSSAPSPAAAGGPDDESSTPKADVTGIDTVDRSLYHTSQHPETAKTSLAALPKLVGRGASRAKDFLDSDPSGVKIDRTGNLKFDGKTQSELEDMYGVEMRDNPGTAETPGGQVRVESPEWQTVKSALRASANANLGQQVAYNGAIKEILMGDLTTKSGVKKAQKVLDAVKSKITKDQVSEIEDLISNFKE